MHINNIPPTNCNVPPLILRYGKKFQGGDAFESLSDLPETRHSILLYTKVN